jgi:metal-responsive CopG/Arc/MetJ family transcriptional regulator
MKSSVTASLDCDLITKLNAASRDKGISRSHVIEAALRHHLGQPAKRVNKPATKPKQ